MKVFIDLGAFDGDTLLLAQKIYPECDNYYAFEPYRPNFQKLTDVFKDNPKIILINKAAGTKAEKVSLFLHNDIKKRQDAAEGNSLLLEKNNVSADNFEEVESINFSQFIKEKFTKEDEIILKIDIEGKEYDVLEQMIEDKTINLIDTLFCEWHQHKIPSLKDRHSKLIERLKEFNLKITGDNNYDEFGKIAERLLKEKTTKISIVIATYNRAVILKELLQSLGNQTDKNFEVVVAIDGSTDNTEEMLTQLKDQLPYELRWINTGLTNTYGLAKARNLGIKEAQGEAVVIIDDDSFPVPNFIAEHKRTVTKKTLTGGARISTDPNDNLADKMQAYLETYGDSTPSKFRPVRTYKYVVENNTCMYKQDWLDSGLFDENITEYGAIGQKFNQQLIKLGYRYQFNPRAAIKHHTEFRQNQNYQRLDKEKVDKILLGNKLAKIRNLLKKYLPPFYYLAKKIKNWWEYR